MDRIHYDRLADSYWTVLSNGKELWCECPVSLEDVLWRLDRQAQRRDLVHLLSVLGLVAGLLALLWRVFW